MKKDILTLLESYLEMPEAWSDNPMIEVDPENPSDLRLCDDTEITDTENSDKDYWDVMDLLRMSVENPGAWEVDPDAVAEMIAAYNS